MEAVFVLEVNAREHVFPNGAALESVVVVTKDVVNIAYPGVTSGIDWEFTVVTHGLVEGPAQFVTVRLVLVGKGALSTLYRHVRGEGLPWSGPVTIAHARGWDVALLVPWCTL